MHFYDPQKTFKNHYFNQNWGPLSVKKVFDNMVLRCMPNSGHGGPPGTRVMTIFVFYVNPQTPNIENFEANEV